MRTIEDVETIGVYEDEIRIVTKRTGRGEEPITISRTTHRLAVTDVIGVDDLLGRNRRLALHMKDGVHCNITETTVKCGLFIGRMD